jgi:glutamate synthase (NADPH/NADH) small chain
MKLDKEIVQRRIGLMAEEGVKFVTNAHVGVDVPARQLKAEFDGIVICTGATNPRDLPIPVRDLKGIYMAMDFLRANTKSLLDSNHNDDNYLSAKDKHVIVIDGGDTGTDCVGTSMHGCKSLTQVEICHDWPTPAWVTIPGRNGPRSISWTTDKKSCRSVRRRPSGLFNNRGEVCR